MSTPAATFFNVSENDRTIQGPKGIVGLTPCEYRLLIALASYEGHTASRAELLRDAWHWTTPQT